MFTKSYRLFSILGFRIGIDLSWFLLAALIVWSLATGFFPDILPGRSAAVYYTISVFAALGMFASIVFHELAHALVARHYQIKIAGITLFIFGGVAELEDEPPTAKSEFLVAIAGPISSYLLAGLLNVLAQMLPSALPAEVFAVLSYLSLINIILATFNLLPAFPLDGGRMLRATLWWIKGSLHKATQVAALLGAILGGALIAFGVYNSFEGGTVGGLWQVLIGFFILNAAGNARRQTEILQILRGLTVRQLMKSAPTGIPAWITVDQLAGYPGLGGLDVFLPVEENGALIGLVQPSIFEKMPHEQRARMRVGDVAKPLKEAEILSPDRTAIGALAQLRRARGHQAFVMTNGKVTGWIEVRDIFAYIDQNANARSADQGRASG